MVICPDCGKEVPKEKFCKNCGAYLENIEEPVKIDAEPVDEIQEESIDKSREIVPVSGEVVVNEPAQNQEKAEDNSRYCVNCGFKITSNYHFVQIAVTILVIITQFLKRLPVRKVHF